MSSFFQSRNYNYRLGLFVDGFARELIITTQSEYLDIIKKEINEINTQIDETLSYRKNQLNSKKFNDIEDEIKKLKLNFFLDLNKKKFLKIKRISFIPVYNFNLKKFNKKKLENLNTINKNNIEVVTAVDYNKNYLLFKLLTSFIFFFLVIKLSYYYFLNRDNLKKLFNSNRKLIKKKF